MTIILLDSELDFFGTETIIFQISLETFVEWNVWNINFPCVCLKEDYVQNVAFFLLVQETKQGCH